MTYTLHRAVLGRQGTFGVLMRGDVPLCVTCEEVWADNKPKISCIPPGTYRVTRHSGTKYKDVWVLHDVPGRSAILIHYGNTVADTEGCILVGRGFNMFGAVPGVTDSVKTIEQLRKILPGEFVLEIRNPC